MISGERIDKNGFNRLQASDITEIIEFPGQAKHIEIISFSLNIPKTCRKHGENRLV